MDPYLLKKYMSTHKPHTKGKDSTVIIIIDDSPHEMTYEVFKETVKMSREEFLRLTATDKPIYLKFEINDDFSFGQFIEIDENTN